MRKRVLASAFAASAAVVPAVAPAAGPSADQFGLRGAQSATVGDVRVELFAGRQLAVAIVRRRHQRAAQLRKRAIKQRHESAAGPIPAVLQTIAACESGGDPTSTDGQFGGKYQFTAQTWASVGGSGNPASAPSAEQDRRATALYRREGTAPWPACGRGR